MGSMVFSSRLSIGRSWKNWKTIPRFLPRHNERWLSVMLVDVDAAHQDVAGGRSIDAGDHVQQGRFSAARFADNGDKLTGVDI